jgi:hypothetical protein
MEVNVLRNVFIKCENSIQNSKFKSQKQASPEIKSVPQEAKTYKSLKEISFFSYTDFDPSCVRASFELKSCASAIHLSA